MAANVWAHYFVYYFFLVDLGVMPTTNLAIMPYILVAIVYLSTFVRYSDFVHLTVHLVCVCVYGFISY